MVSPDSDATNKHADGGPLGSLRRDEVPAAAAAVPTTPSLPSSTTDASCWCSTGSSGAALLLVASVIGVVCVCCVCVLGAWGLGYVFVTQTDLTLTHTQARTPLSLVSCTNHELQSVQEQHGTEHILSPQHREQHATSSSTATVAWLLLQLARSRAPCATTPRTPPQKQHLPRRHTLATTTNHLQLLAPIHTKSEPSNPGRDTHHGRRTHTQATASATKIGRAHV